MKKEHLDPRRWTDTIAIFLLVAILWMASSRLQDTDWTDDLIRVKFLVMVACPLGLLLGKSLFGRRTVVVFSIVYSFYFIPWQLGLMMESEIGWSERLLSIWGRMSINFQLFISNQPVKDSILFLFIMMVMFWVLSLVSCYQLVRYGQVWIPLLILGVAFFTIDFYHPTLKHREFYSGMFVFFVLLLVSRVYFLSRREEWREKGIAMDVDTGKSLSWSMMVGGAFLVLLAWNVPTILEATVANSPAQKQLLDSLSSVRKRFSNLVAGLQSPVIYVNDLYGDNLQLGTGAQLGNDVIFTVKVQNVRETGYRYYWHGRSYDLYEKGKWSNTINSRQALLPVDWPLGFATLEGRLHIYLTYTIRSSVVRLMYIPSLPYAFSRPVQVMGQQIVEGNGTDRKSDYDAIGLMTTQQVKSGEIINAQSWISAPTVLQLKEAGTNYPFWVKHYLQIPPDFSTKVSDLAFQITKGAETPYDKTVAIIDYLRTNIKYEEVIPAPPPGRDSLEWFLFDYKKGFCNYYATAAVMMLRVVGVPARLAVGFAQGTYDSPSHSYTVVMRDSHAWPEVYYPGLGWVEFEPTASQPATQYLSGENRENQAAASSGAAPTPFDPHNLYNQRDRALELEEARQQSLLNTRMTSWIWLIGTLVLIGLFLFIWRRFSVVFREQPFPAWLEANLRTRGWYIPTWISLWAQYSQFTQVERLFIGVLAMLKLLGERGSPGQTPAERIQALVQVAPIIRESSQALLSEYERSVYSPYPCNLPRARQAVLDMWKGVTLVWAKRLIGGTSE